MSSAAEKSEYLPKISDGSLLAALAVAGTACIAVLVFYKYQGFLFDAAGWLLAPLMLPIHLLGELAKPISLSCRLFGNIFGEDMLMVAFATIGISMLAGLHVPFGVPLHAPFFLLALLTSGLQALVFTVLSTIYVLLMLPHDDHGHEGEGQHAH